MERKFNSIIELVNFLKGELPPDIYGLDNNCYEWIDYRDAYPGETDWFDYENDFPGGRILPAMAYPYLYRGQTKLHSPCRPFVYRDFPLVNKPRELSISQRLKYVLSQIQLCWFSNEIRFHPAWEYAHSIGLQVNPVAIAQHYGIPTVYLDMTQSIDVAAFFATCCLNNRKWEPSKDDEGVIYRLNLGAISAFLEGVERIELVGLSTFPRPDEQKAWVVPISFNGDFNNLPFVDKYFFKHTYQGSSYYLNLFDNGNLIFPYDPIQNLVDFIKQSDTLPVSHVANALRGMGCPYDRLQIHFNRIKDALEQQFSLKVANEVQSPLTDDQIEFLKNYWEVRGKKFLQNVGVRSVKIFNKEDWYSRKDALKALNCTITDYYKLIKNGILESHRAFKVGSKKPIILVSKKSVREYINHEQNKEKMRITSQHPQAGPSDPKLAEYK